MNFSDIESRFTVEIEARFPVGEPTNWHLSVTGEPYVVIGPQAEVNPIIPGAIDEGMPREMPFDEETAYYSALLSFNQYAEDREGVLYWRVKPQLEWTEDRKRCTLYMRCLISNKAPEEKFRSCP